VPEAKLEVGITERVQKYGGRLEENDQLMERKLGQLRQMKPDGARELRKTIAAILKDDEAKQAFHDKPSGLIRCTKDQRIVWRCQGCAAVRAEHQVCATNTKAAGSGGGYRRGTGQAVGHHRCVVALRPGYRARGGRVLRDLGPVLIVYVWLKGVRPVDERALPRTARMPRGCCRWRRATRQTWLVHSCGAAGAKVNPSPGVSAPSAWPELTSTRCTSASSAMSVPRSNSVVK